MQRSTTNRGTTLSAIMIAPDRALAAQFAGSSDGPKVFEILLELKSYPTGQTLDIRIRQLQPEVVLVDVASDLDTAVEIISTISRSHPDVTVVALDCQSGSDTILRVLRAGAGEFLYAPFDAGQTSEAVSRLLRLRKPDPTSEREPGKVCVFSSVKPGSGASTLATQCAFALRRGTDRRVLLADLDLTGGTIGLYLKLDHGFSIVDALEQADNLQASTWTSLVANCGGIDILPAPLVPFVGYLDMGRLQNVLDFARTMYEWVVFDLPVIFQRNSLAAVPQADRTLLVSTSELPSLNLARRSVMMLEQLGFPKDRFRMVVNRVSKRDGITKADMEKLFNCPIYASLPNDYFSLHRVVTLGQPLESDSCLGKAIESLARQLSGGAGAGKKVPAFK